MRKAAVSFVFLVTSVLLPVAVTFEDDGGRTIMTLEHAGIPSGTIADCEAGWNGSFDKLADILE